MELTIEQKNRGRRTQIWVENGENYGECCDRIGIPRTYESIRQLQEEQVEYCKLIRIPKTTPLTAARGRNLTASWNRKDEGEEPKLLAAELGIGVGQLKELWKKFLGKDAEKAKREVAKQLKAEQREAVEEAEEEADRKSAPRRGRITQILITKGNTYKECCIGLGISSKPRSLRKLREMHAAYCVENNLQVAQPPRRKKGQTKELDLKLEVRWEDRIVKETTDEQVAKEFGFSETQLRIRWRNLGKDTLALHNRERREVITKRCVEVHKLRLVNNSYDKISASMGLSRTTGHLLRVQHMNYCEENAIPFPILSRTQERDLKVHDLRLSGYTYTECCAHFNLDPSKKNLGKLRASHKNFCDRTATKWPDRNKIRKAAKSRKQERQNKKYSDAWKLRKDDNVPTKELAAKLEISIQTLLKHWNDLGFNPAEAHFKDVSIEERNEEVHKLREQGFTYRECCSELGMVPTSKNAGKLKGAYRAWCLKNAKTTKFKGNVLTEEQETMFRAALELRKIRVPYKQICAQLGRPEKEANNFPARLGHFCRSRNITWPLQANA